MTPEYLRDRFDYDQESGLLYWVALPGKTKEERRWNARYAGKCAGSNRGRYTSVKLCGRMHQAHRIIWSVVYGASPPDFIDHINGDCHDNRICNLRAASRSQNIANSKRRKDNSSGYKGVVLEYGKWVAKFGKERRALGYFDSPEEAAKAYDKAAKSFYGEFARPNFGDIRK